MSTIKSFFKRYPSLIFAISAIVGAEAALQSAPVWLLLLLLAYFLYKKWIYTSLYGLTVFFLTSYSIQLSPIPEEGVTGKARIRIDHLSYKKGQYQASWIYKGRVQAFDGEGISIKGIPFFLSLPAKKDNRPLANCDYEILCHIKKGKGNQLILKPLTSASWQALESFSLSELRFFMKNKVKRWIERQFSSPSTNQFLSGLVIGEFDDRQLREDFGRFGLLHLLAISGFHFSILAGLLELLLRPFFHAGRLTFAMLIILSLYFLFLGWGPSLLRAWITLLLYLGAYFHEKFSSPINSLGVALLTSIFLDPLLLENLGFQFSFLTTAAILLGLESFSNLFNRIFPKRASDTVITWRWEDQLTYILLGFMKNGLSLACATTFIAWPLSIYYFGTFPLLSLVYNIFFPFLVSISMALLLIGSLLSFIPPLASKIHLVNDYFTSFILNMTYDLPKSWDYIVQGPHFSSIQLIIYIIIIFVISIYFQKYNKELKYKGMN